MICVESSSSLPSISPSHDYTHDCMTCYTCNPDLLHIPNTMTNTIDDTTNKSIPPHRQLAEFHNRQLVLFLQEFSSILSPPSSNTPNQEIQEIQEIQYSYQKSLGQLITISQPIIHPYNDLRSSILLLTRDFIKNHNQLCPTFCVELMMQWFLNIDCSQLPSWMSTIVYMKTKNRSMVLNLSSLLSYNPSLFCNLLCFLFDYAIQHVNDIRSHNISPYLPFLLDEIHKEKVEPGILDTKTVAILILAAIRQPQKHEYILHVASFIDASQLFPMMHIIVLGLQSSFYNQVLTKPIFYTKDDDDVNIANNLLHILTRFINHHFTLCKTIIQFLRQELPQLNFSLGILKTGQEIHCVALLVELLSQPISSLSANTISNHWLFGNGRSQFYSFFGNHRLENFSEEDIPITIHESANESLFLSSPSFPSFPSSQPPIKIHTMTWSKQQPLFRGTHSLNEELKSWWQCRGKCHVPLFLSPSSSGMIKMPGTEETSPCTHRLTWTTWSLGTAAAYCNNTNNKQVINNDECGIIVFLPRHDIDQLLPMYHQCSPNVDRLRSILSFAIHCESLYQEEEREEFNALLRQLQYYLLKAIKSSNRDHDVVAQVGPWNKYGINEYRINLANVCQGRPVVHPKPGEKMVVEDTNHPLSLLREVVKTMADEEKEGKEGKEKEKEGEEKEEKEEKETTTAGFWPSSFLLPLQVTPAEALYNNHGERDEAMRLIKSPFHGWVRESDSSQILLWDAHRHLQPAAIITSVFGQSIVYDLLRPRLKWLPIVTALSILGWNITACATLETGHLFDTTRMKTIDDVYILLGLMAAHPNKLYVERDLIEKSCKIPCFVIDHLWPTRPDNFDYTIAYLHLQSESKMDRIPMLFEDASDYFKKPLCKSPSSVSRLLSLALDRLKLTKEEAVAIYWQQVEVSISV